MKNRAEEDRYLVELSNKFRDLLFLLIEVLSKDRVEALNQLKDDFKCIVEEKLDAFDYAFYERFSDLEYELKSEIEFIDRRLDQLEIKINNLIDKINNMFNLLEEVKAQILSIRETRRIEEDINAFIFKEIYVNNSSIDELAEKLNMKVTEITEIYRQLLKAKENFIKYIEYYKPTKNELLQQIPTLIPKWMYDLLLKIGEITEINDNGTIRIIYTYE